MERTSEWEREKQQLMNETEDKMKLVTASAESTTCFQYFDSVRFCFVSVAVDAIAAVTAFFSLVSSEFGFYFCASQWMYWNAQTKILAVHANHMRIREISPVSGLHEQFHPVHWAAANIDIFTRTADVHLLLLSNSMNMHVPFFSVPLVHGKYFSISYILRR